MATAIVTWFAVARSNFLLEGVIFDLSQKAEHPRLYVWVLSSGAHFCDKPNLTPSNKKFLSRDKGASAAASKKDPDNEQYAKVQPIVGIFAERCICNPSREKSVRWFRW